jgi:23S rRNA (guanosine2251-2'-O)-methyltransferase
VIGSDAAGEQFYTKVDYTSPIALVVGNEGAGVRRLVKEKCDTVVKIPLYGKIEALNASVSGALLMYEVIRKRKFAN